MEGAWITSALLLVVVLLFVAFFYKYVTYIYIVCISIICIYIYIFDVYIYISLSQWLNFKLFGITYLVGKIKFKLFFFRVHWLSEIYICLFHVLYIYIYIGFIWIYICILCIYKYIYIYIHIYIYYVYIHLLHKTQPISWLSQYIDGRSPAHLACIKSCKLDSRIN